jgi:hypothetical protein
MKKAFLLRWSGIGLLLALLLAGPAELPARAQTPSPGITAPQAGQILQGLVMVTGSSAVEGFLSAEVAFAYADDPTGTWFLIAVSDQPVEDGVLAAWDTTVITDERYNLRLRVFLTDGTFVDVLVPDLWVRNYTPTETLTPTITPTLTETPVLLTPVLPTDTPPPTFTPSRFPTPTPLPTNPAVLPVSQVYRSAGYGALIILAAFSLLGIYTLLRRP